MKRKPNKRAVTLLVCLTVLATAAVGTTLAYLFASTPTVKNAFSPARVTCSVEEAFDGSTTSNVQLRNTGNTDAYIRAAVVVTWKNSAGEVYAAAPAEGTDYSISWNLSATGWVKADDSFCYYTKEVAPCTHTDGQAHNGCLTAVLIDTCSPVSGKAPPGYTLSVEIVASAIQSAPDAVVGGQWSNAKVSVAGSNGTLTVTNLGG